jgi:SAM-dependent methyltransferase
MTESTIREQRAWDLATPRDADQLAGLARELWTKGDYPAIADAFIPDLGRRLVDHARIAKGERVLDVAAGVGNAALPAAARGAQVTALDIVPELVADGERRAEALGLAVQWLVGDASALPFEDGGFDAVLSCVGIQFAAPHDQVARELVRVLGARGRLALINWTPTGFVGQVIKTAGAYLPPPPPGVSPPPLWGDRGYVRSLLEPEGLSLEFKTEVVDFWRPSVEDLVDYTSDRYAPLRSARERLEPTGGWEPLREELIALAAEASDGGDAFHVESEYLVVVGTRGRKDVT